MSDPNPQVGENFLTPEEITTLKSLARKPPRPWWRDYPFLVSLCAFLLALITAIISAYSSYVRDVHDQQAQLSAAVATLQKLNVERLDLHQKYQGTQDDNLADGFINNEADSTLHSAEKISLHLKDRGAPADLVVIAQDLESVGEYEPEGKLLEYALASSENANEKSIALRDLGTYSIVIKKTPDAIKEGNDYFQQALMVDRDYGIEQPVAVAWLRTAADFDWSAALAISGDCGDAQAHFADGVDILKKAPVNSEIERAKGIARAVWSYGIGGVATCMPNSNTQPFAP
jgi:hypothetical protein